MMEPILLFALGLVIFTIFIYELLYRLEVIEAEDKLDLKLPNLVRVSLWVNPLVTITGFLFLILYLVIQIIG